MNVNLVTVLVLVFSCVQSSKESSMEYVAAVYEHAAFSIPATKNLPRELALEIMMVNLAVYDDQARKAKSRKAQIIVFPEDGIHGYADYKREDIVPFLETIPKPSSLEPPWNPCLDPNRFSYTEVLHKLSCIAMNNSIAVVANMGDFQPCSKSSDPNCPDDNRYQYNTDVVFDLDGTFLAKYHKQHLFHEVQFNTPSKCEYVTFTTGFGVRFGVFTCFDMLFKSPAVDLVVKYGVRNIVFPTWWFGGFPILMSVQYQQSWSRTNCVNLLAANQHQVIHSTYSFGSGIYSCGEIKAYVSDALATKDQRLLVATLRDLERSGEGLNAHAPGMSTPEAKSKHPPQKQSFNREPSSIKEAMAQTFEGTIMNDIYTMKTLKSRNTSISVCQNKLCCNLDYIMAGRSNFEENYALGVFRGSHTRDSYYLEVCVLLKCAGAGEKQCGTTVELASTVFDHVELSGNFTSTAKVYPEILTNGLKLAGKHEVSFSGHATMTTDKLKEPLISAVLLGRDYSKDKL